ncbi:competence type IV pilus minor pilin ComGG [Bacillus dakarensis]|uniref:competence type IV pilus minor pilin ComGG n=1 Tax=Robertmurraya dakarensis TaxID=1926278 RepID=UPI0009822868|nr:competence type IV pilus minor pilin ComGG [Bacillus dakarensis]
MNEKGFMYPVTLCILMLFSIFLAVQFNQYLAEKKLLQEISHLERNQSYFLQSLIKVEKLLINGNVGTSGKIYFEEGTVTYEIQPINAYMLQIIFNLKVVDNDSILTGFGYFDLEYMKMISWAERK